MQKSGTKRLISECAGFLIREKCVHIHAKSNFTFLKFEIEEN